MRQPRFSILEGPRLTPMSLQWILSGSGACWMVSSCASAWLCPVAALMCPSWEFLTALNYEWSIIQGHRPYRWSISVCDDTLRSGSGHPGGPQIDLQVL